MHIAFSVILVLAVQAMLLGSVQGRSLPRAQRYAMNERGIRWDRSCNDNNPQNPSERKKDAVRRAWAGAMELNISALSRFRQTLGRIQRRQSHTDAPLSTDDQSYINARDPAYTQLFALDWTQETLNRVYKVFDALANRVNADPGTKGRPSGERGIVTIFCKNQWIEDGVDECKKGGEKVGIFTGDYPDEQSEWKFKDAHMNFCEEFWSEFRYDRLKIATQVSRPGENGVTNQEFYRARHNMFQNPKAVNIDATSVSHEMAHLFWVGSEKIGGRFYSGGLNQANYLDSCQQIAETYGMYTCALLAWNKGKPFAGDLDTSWNAEQYALYAEYVRFFDLTGTRDYWRPDLKPVKIPVPLEMA